MIAAMLYCLKSAAVAPVHDRQGKRMTPGSFHAAVRCLICGDGPWKPR